MNGTNSHERSLIESTRQFVLEAAKTVRLKVFRNESFENQIIFKVRISLLSKGGYVLAALTKGDDSFTLVQLGAASTSFYVDVPTKNALKALSEVIQESEKYKAIEKNSTI